LLVRLILQNKGKLSKGKRETFSEISDQEIDRIEKAVWRAGQENLQDQLSENR
jgi:alpha-D-ribose 1-methylphosphonate 5-triphosphate diphosphatase PhnM